MGAKLTTASGDCVGTTKRSVASFHIQHRVAM